MMSFRHNHQELTLRTLQGLDQKKARDLNSTTITKFYEILHDLYATYGYGLIKLGNNLILVKLFDSIHLLISFINVSSSLSCI